MRNPTLMPSTSRAPSVGALCASAYLITAIALGGGGSPAPFPELILELLAGALVAITFTLPAAGIDLQAIPRLAWVVAALTVAIPLLQLVPLPPFLWHALPGREVELRALALVGAEDSWRTWSMAPSRTLSSLLSLGPPLLSLLLASMLGRRQQLWLVSAIAVMTLATLLLGALQLTSGQDSAVHLYGVSAPMLVGFQANHNSTADVLLIGLLTIPMLAIELVERKIIPNRPLPVLSISAAGISVIALGVILTASRMGIILLPLPLLASLWLLRPWLALNPRHIAYGAGALIVSAGLGLLIVRGNPVLQAVAARFDFSGELRPQLWRDGFYVAQKYFPFGVGMGNFVPALFANERLEAIYPSLPNRAHNDFLELACEAGALGMLVLSAISWTLIRALRQRLRDGDSHTEAMAVFSGASLFLLSLHSLVDYPFRSMALACVGATCAGLILGPQRGGVTARDALSAGKTR